MRREIAIAGGRSHWANSHAGRKGHFSERMHPSPNHGPLMSIARKNMPGKADRASIDAH